ncbi:MAG TPA: nucleoside 2-deoxyribosyltransferase [Blastocatellia bacterium]|nr:nucleoside 2-deoxyribosyltransferase [Blastocatellia bacterium]
MPDSNQEFYAIVVNVPEARDLCFIATPFADEFDGVAQAVATAANRLKLQAVQTNKVQMGADFIQDIVNGIRSARVVVAVCSPEPQTGKANPNVLYELGMAHALGKPTIILTTDFSTLPSDIYTKYALKYQSGAIDSALVDRVAFELQARITRMKDPLTDSDWRQHGVSVAHERHRMFLQPDFWDHFRGILSFAKTIHDEIQGIDTAHADNLLREIEGVVFAAGEELRRIRDFIAAATSYMSYYQNRTRPNTFDRLGDLKSKVEDSFAYLLNNSDAATRQQVRLSQGFYTAIERQLGEYQKLNDKLVDDARGNLIPLLQDREKATSFYVEIRNLSSTTKTLIINADRLIVNLVDLIRGEGA